MEKLRLFFEANDGRLIASLIVISALYLLKFIFTRIFESRVKPLRKRYLVRQTIYYIWLITLVLLLIIIWMELLGSIVTLLSLVLGAIIISSKEFILNFLANFVIIWRGLFQVGDRIEIGDITGDVIESGPMYVTLVELNGWAGGDEPSGRLVKIPNSHVLTKPVMNFTRGHNLIWNEIRFAISPTGNIEKARNIALEIIDAKHYKFSEEEIEQISEEHNDFLFLNNNPAVNIELKDSKLELCMRYACKIHKRRQSANEIWTELIAKIKSEEDIELK